MYLRNCPIGSVKMHVKGLKGCVSEENCRSKCKLLPSKQRLRLRLRLKLRLRLRPRRTGPSPSSKTKKIQVDPESQRSVEQFEDNNTFEEFEVENKFKNDHTFEEFEVKKRVQR